MIGHNKKFSRLLVYVLNIVLLTMTYGWATMSYAQPVTPPQLKLGNQSQLKLSASAQLWLRTTELNPGTTIQGETKDYVSDVSIRRFRMILSGSITDRWYVKFQLGTNNLNYINNNSTLKILDIETSYRFADVFEIGGGKNAYVGLSRYAAPATSSALSYDCPLFTMPTVGISDDLLRKFSLYAKGNIGHFAYRAVVARPLAVYQNTLSEEANFYSNFPDLQYSAYLSYEFMDRESQTSAFKAGTYHGSKKIINLSVGFLYQEDALAGLDTQMDTISYDMLLLAADFFMDLPLNNENSRSVTVYLGYFDYDFGKDYIRLSGANNPSNGVRNGSYAGAGNSFPTTGTGQVAYLQLGYRTRISPNEKLPYLQPYASIQVADYDGLNDQMIMYDYGLNFLFDGHRSKLTLAIQNRPIYSNQTRDYSQVTERMDMWILQYQFKI
ncbi:hypothetical protein SAMN04488028_10335 [Reichenbachiella agariperforans]|uniref:Phosphate-selective porin O and P n=1 Tax=Reichenbachiella agariperforans TaxID=156994 RepID=A0A1M6PTZ4_REIAG|nr:hypothetical protein [Reichenbachiella agariperforans]SHK11382.1 hypothetical protein SAMN04488028_10335 [Reichenbachiella agariperforans]